MKAPSFRCTENQDGTLILHYYSDRPGLEFIVIGLVKTVSFQLHKSEVECKLFKSKGDDCDHVQFLIIEKVHQNKENNLEINEIKLKLQKYLKPNISMISMKTFCKVFPFHIIFDRNMIVKQYGSSISRFIPQIKNKDCKITSIFNIVRPHINLEFAAIRAHVMSVFVLTNKTYNL
jgi:guanylate cyclase soluble subunit beta